MFKVSLKGLNDVKAQFESATKDLEMIVEEEVAAMAQDWVAGSIRDAPKDTGSAGLSGAISFTPVQNLSTEIVAQKFYAPFMEFGTKGKYLPIPGTEKIAAQFKGYKGGSFSEMLKMIELWVARKGITGTYSVKTRARTGGKALINTQNKQAAFAIALSILKHGISPHPFFFKQQEIVWPAMIKRIKARIESKSKVSVIAPGDISHPKIITI